MLSIENSTNAAWRVQFLQLLPDGIETEGAVAATFEEAMRWADETRRRWASDEKNKHYKELLESPYGRCLEHKREPSGYFAAQYLRTLRADGVPVIPCFTRAFCAHRLGLKVAESKKHSPSARHVRKSVPGRKTQPRPRVNLAIARA